MIIGVPREIKKEEYRVGMTPFGVRQLKEDGHTVLIEEKAGEGSGFSDGEYLDADADIVDRSTLFSTAELIVKVKEPLPQEYDLFREGQVLFTYLHLAPNRALTAALIRKKVVALGYETLEKDGYLPLLAPMSEIAGRMSPLVGAWFLQKFRGGKGILPTGATGVQPGKAVILGAGVVGFNAAKVAVGLGMETVVMNRGIEKLKKLNELLGDRVKTSALSSQTLNEEIRDADLIIGALLVPGGRTPVLISREMLKTIGKGTVLVDVSVDQGGCFETSQPTTHDNPVYEVDGIIHYAVANMPGAYPRTSTLALTNATIPYIRLIGKIGIERALEEDGAVRSSLNIFRGKVVHPALATSMEMTKKEG